MRKLGSSDPRTRMESDLQAWRSRALYLVLMVILGTGLLAYASTIVGAVLRGHATPLLWIYAGVYVAFALLAFLPRLNVTLRASAVFFVAYANAAASLARLGLAGSGRLYLIILPAAAVILISGRAGWLCLAVSLGMYAGFASLAAGGILANWLAEKENPLSAGFWIEAGAALAVFLITLTVLVERFYTKHLRTLAASNRIATELEHAYEALDQRMQARTRELELVNSIAAVVSGLVSLRDILRVSLVKTMQAFGIEAGGAYAREEESGTLVMLAHRGLSEEFVRRMKRLPLETAMAGKQISLDQPVFFSVDEYPEGQLKQFIIAEGLKRMIGVPLAAKGKVVGGLVLNSRWDRVLTQEEGSLLIAIGRQIGLAIENARLLEREKIGRADADRRREVAEGLREMLSVLNSNRPLQETLNFIVSQACRLIGSDAASLLQTEPLGGVLRIRASCGLDPEYVAQVQFSPGRGGAGRALAAQEPVTVPDAGAFVESQKREMSAEYAEEVAGLRLMVSRGFRALLSVPLIVQGEGYGGITLYYRQPRNFSDEEVLVATSLASQAALAIQNARLRGQAEQAAVFAERNRLARELHDSVTQSLYSVTLYAEAAARHLQGNQTAEAAEHLRELGGTAREALREMRLLIFELAPPALEKGSLVDALQIRLDAVESRGGMSVSYNVEGTERLDPRVRQELYQIAQEALNNTLKHSRAHAVRILLRFGEEEARLEISDDGVGFEFDQAQSSGGIGMRSMRERVERIGGGLTVDSAPGRGTCVSVVAPMLRQDP